ncbi:hypothetical protein [Nonomuraea maritima]|uniref:hypothetical protein n=1 Tax=Nonomuraea maritima TaxID=683260 RepID=UPI0037162593
MPLLVIVGIAELVVAVLSGWLMVVVVRAPTALRRVGVRQRSRIRQAHLDLVMMGVIQVAVGTAVRPLTLWVALAIAFGSVAQPLGFLPLALRPHLARNPTFQLLAAAVFTTTTVGWIVLAAELIT